ncbi:MAG TPA: S53 family peptidase [Pirellulales bacterium]|nr:S53 family peptidase [Pirellulales bacterium]
MAESDLHALGVTNVTPQGFTPSQIRQAYAFNQIALAGGVQGNGSGQTIAIVDAYDDPNIASDLHAFDATFGIADPPSFSKLNQRGGTAAPQADAGWSEEIALDVEWAHAMAPAANILLVEANSSSLTDLMAAVDVARGTPGVSVVSMSWGSSEFFGQTQYDSHFTTPAGHTPIVFVASAGDSGAGAEWPAASPNVVAVGGTSLSISGGTYAGESAWSGSGGGFSQVEREPSFQSGVQSSGARTIPDVAYDANPNTGVAVFDSVPVGGRSGWFEIGGTSAGAPQWAALLAIADQGRALGGQATLNGADTALYKLPASDFHDVVSGSNGYRATAGYDLVTGRGTPIASSVVRDLVGNVVATSTSSSSSSSSTTTTTTTTTPTHPRHYYYELIYYHGRWWLVLVSSPNALDSANNSPQLDQLVNESAAAVLNTNTTSAASTAAGATNSAPQAGTGQAAASESAQAPSSPVAFNMTAPSPVGGAGQRAPVAAQAERADSDPSAEQDEANRDATDGSASSAAASTTRASSAAATVSIAAAVSGAEAASQVSIPLSVPALDFCFANDAWAAPADLLAAVPALPIRCWDIDLAALAIGLTLALHNRRPQPAADPSNNLRRLRPPQRR